MKHREALTEVKDATETEELVGASSDRLEQDGSGVQQLREEDETGDPSEETEAQQVCKPVIVCWATCSSIVNYVHNIHTLTVLIIHVEILLWTIKHANSHSKTSMQRFARHRLCQAYNVCCIEVFE